MKRKIKFCIFIFLFCILNNIKGEVLKKWDNLKYGNHRAVVLVDKNVDAAYSKIEWRRRDDNASQKEIIIVDSKTKKIVPRKNKQYIHTEYSGDAKYAYLSIYEKDGAIIVLDTKTLKEIVSYPANMPVGKYNFINKNRQFYPSLFGNSIAKEKTKKILNRYEKRSLRAYLKTIMNNQDF